MVTREDINAMPDMVRWFDPGVLLKILRPVIVSGIFGTYADRRLMQAALDRETKAEVWHDVRNLMSPGENGDAWFDFIADTGDGFDSTYSVAWMQAQPSLEVGGEKTYRGQLLVFGGDQVYPDANKENYTRRFKTPYSWALPDDKLPDDQQPKIYAIPGNHDWYDGLLLFLAYFCRREPAPIGKWRTQQRRSYFALRLTESLWLWGVDIQLSEDVDAPQADYFIEVAEKMPRGASIIICTAVPGWYSPEEKGFACLGYFNHKVILKVDRNLRVCLVLSGDVHHYSRYQAPDNLQFITAGGGGAFLHPTHTLRRKVSAFWNRKRVELCLAKKQGSEEEACYPSRRESRRYALRNCAFAFLNLKFTALMGALYAAAGLTTLMWNDASIGSIAINFVFWIWAFIFFGMFFGYADKSEWSRSGKVLQQPTRPWQRRLLLGGVHATLHLTACAALARAIYLGLAASGLEFWTWPFNLAFLAACGVVGGLIGATIFGAYLAATCLGIGASANDAFSSLSLSMYRNFLRLRCKDGKLTIYPVGLHRVPHRSDWIPNPGGESPSAVVPRQRLNPILIEKPIEIAIPPLSGEATQNHTA